MAVKKLPETVSTEELRWLLGNLSAARISQLATEGIVERVGRGRYTIASVPAVVKAMRDRSQGPQDYQALRTRLMASRARSAEREEQKAAGQLVETELVIADWSSIAKTLATHFRAMPTLLAPRMVLCQTEVEAFTAMTEVVEQHLADFADAKLSFIDDPPDDQPATRNGKDGGHSSPGEVGSP